jgi:hypothetical protein
VTATTDYLDPIRANLMTETGAEGHWPDDRLLAVVNDARQEMALVVNEAYGSQFDTEVELTTNADGFLDLPADFVRETRLQKGTLANIAGRQGVTIVNSTDYKRYQSAFGNVYGVGRDESWAFIGNQAKPTLANGVVGETYVLTYSQELADFTDVGDSEDARVTRSMKRMVVLKGTSLALAISEEHPSADRFEGRFQELAGKIVSEAARRSLSREDGIRDVMGYMDEEDVWPRADV